MWERCSKWNAIKIICKIEFAFLFVPNSGLLLCVFVCSCSSCRNLDKIRASSSGSIQKKCINLWLLWNCRASWLFRCIFFFFSLSFVASVPLRFVASVIWHIPIRLMSLHDIYFFLLCLHPKIVTNTNWSPIHIDINCLFFFFSFHSNCSNGNWLCSANWSGTFHRWHHWTFSSIFWFACQSAVDTRTSTKSRNMLRHSSHWPPVVSKQSIVNAFIINRIRSPVLNSNPNAIDWIFA